jgi:hypothetical protein
MNICKYRFNLRKCSEIPRDAPKYRFHRVLTARDLTFTNPIPSDKFRKKLALLWKHDFNINNTYIAKCIPPLSNQSKLPHFPRDISTRKNTVPSVISHITKSIGNYRPNNKRYTNNTIINTNEIKPEIFHAPSPFKPKVSDDEIDKLFKSKLTKHDLQDTINAKQDLFESIDKHKRKGTHQINLNPLKKNKTSNIEWEVELDDEFDDDKDAFIQDEIIRKQNEQYKCYSPGREYDNQNNRDSSFNIDQQTECWTRDNKGSDRAEFQSFLNSVKKVDTMQKQQAQQNNLTDKAFLRKFLKEQRYIRDHKNKHTFDASI